MILAVFDGPERFAFFLASAAAAAGTTFFFFYFRMIGAGDCKLMALVCGYLGIRDGLFTVAAGFVIGAVWALGKLFFQNQAPWRAAHFSAWLRQTLQTKQMIPYYSVKTDGYKATVPLAACMMGGFLIFVCLKAI